MVLLAALLLPAARAASADSSTWVGTTGGKWSVSSSWDTDPIVPNSGAAATFAPVPGALKPQAIDIDIPVTLSQLTFDSAIPYTLTPSATGSLALTGPAIVDVKASTIDHPFGTPAAGHTIGNLGGTAGLRKTGSGTLTLAGTNTYQGTTWITGGVLSVATDAALGAPANSIGIDGAALRSTFSTNPGFARDIYLGPSGGILQISGSDMTISGVISGPGGLTHQSVPLAIGASFGNLYLTNVNTYTGPTTVQTTATRLALDGSISSSSVINLEGTLVLDNRTTARSGRLGHVPVNLSGGGLSVLAASSTPIDESVDSLVLQADSQNSITLGTDVRLSASSLHRIGRATLFLGSTAGRGGLILPQGTVPVSGTGTPGTPSVGIVPWVFTNTTSTDPLAGHLTTYDVAGIRDLRPGEYSTTLPSGVTNVNVSLSSSTAVSAPVTVNALETRSSADGSPITLSGAAPITVRSGAVAIGGSYATLSVPLDFGAAEGVVFAANQLNLTGPISGSNGLTVSRGLVSLTGASTYTGTTTISGALDISSDTTPGAPGPLGTDTSPVVLAPGQSLLRFSGPSPLTFARDLKVEAGARQVASIQTPTTIYTSLAPVRLTGRVQLTGGNLQVNGNFQVEGPITGDGRLLLGGTLSLAGTGNNYSGGTLLGTQRLTVNENDVLGSGPILYSAGDLYSPAPHVLHNAVVFENSTLVYSGPSSLSFAGPIDLNGRTVLVNASSGELRFDGPVTNGALELSAATLNERIVLSGANAFTGVTTVDSQTRVNVRNRLALGAAAKPTTFQYGSILEIEGGVRDGPAALQLYNVLHSISGDNSWAGPITFAGGKADITVDADSLELPLPTSAATSLTKRGPGLLRIYNTRANTLAILGGALRLRSGGGDVGTSRATSVSISPGAFFDLADHTLAIDYASTSPAAVIRGYLASHALVGAGAVGYGEASKLLGLTGTQTTSYHAVTVDATTLLVMSTLPADANLDGSVNFNDLVALAQHYNDASGSRLWTDGDFNYDRKVNFDDLVLLAQNYNTSPPVGPVPGASAGFDADLATAFASVPEPGALGVVLVAALARRSRRRPLTP